MIGDDRVIPFRPLPRFDGPPDTLMALLEATEGLPDVTVARLIDRYFPEAAEWLRTTPAREPGAWMNVNSDGWMLWATDLGAIAGYAEALEDMPSDADIDRAVALRATGSRPTLEECRHALSAKADSLQVRKMPCLRPDGAHACSTLGDFHPTPHGTPGEGASARTEDGAPAGEKGTPLAQSAPHGTHALADKSPGDSQVWQDGQTSLGPPSAADHPEKRCVRLHGPSRTSLPGRG